MIISTTGIEGKKILAYKGIVFGEVVAGVNMFKDMSAGFRNVFGGRASSYEGELTQAREEALAEMMERASERGANAIGHIERIAFYEEAKTAYAIIATSEKALYANIMLQKGVVVD